MKRFLVFPFTLGICGALFVVVYVSQSLAVLWPFIRQQTNAAFMYNFLFNINDLWRINSRNGLLLGLLAGVGMAIWDTLRNQRDQSSLTRLGSNFFWCGCYALLINSANGLLNWLLSTQSIITTASWYFSLSWNSSAIINCTAILWAAIRSITTDDVLTPRVLGAKLQGRANL